MFLQTCPFVRRRVTAAFTVFLITPDEDMKEDFQGCFRKRQKEKTNVCGEREGSDGD